MSHKFDAALDAVLHADARYARASFHFLRDVLESLQTVGRGVRRKNVRVAAADLLECIRQEAIRQFGPMAATVFEDWGIRSSDDIGEMVYLLMGHGIVMRDSEDRREDFSGVYDFATALSQPLDAPADSRGAPRCRSGHPRPAVTTQEHVP